MLRKDSRARPGLETCLRLGKGGGLVFYKLKDAIIIDVHFHAVEVKQSASFHLKHDNHR